ncbi:MULTISPECIES: YadA C-terminal domain-containing protein [Neisseria]|uniref:YadA-like family protein n=1 Tax=Neisseria macacae ATCC 33926 TaxID=997348 RepID=A0ABY3Y8E5_9NEIS|nr:MULTISPECIES: YadA C-terminal domain-containing protein [Neisseria]UNV85223.1 YadA-like family protein [Neisseria macacae ATCC 33926]
MKKFNVKALSLAVAAAVVSGAAAAEEVNFAKAVGEKPDQGQAAFFTVFGEGTTYDKGTGKLTFKKDSDALLLKTLELEQTINGFASGSNFITTDANGNKTVREATNEDIEADSLKGVGLAGGLTAVNARVDNLAKETSAALDDQDETIEQLKTAITTNGTRIAEVATGVNDLNKSVTKMGEDISSKFDEVDSEISKASSELSESIEKVSEDVTAVNTRVDSLAQDAADAKANAKAAEDKVTALSANVDSKVKEAKDAADKAKDASDKAVDAASKIDAVADKADKASKGVAGLTEALEKVAEQSALAAAENTQALNGFAEGDEIVVTDADGIKSVKKATKEDVEQDEFGGLGLKEVVAQHDQSLADLTAETERAKKAAEQAAFAAIENAQELNGFKEKDEIIVTDDNGVKSVKTATKEDVEADEFKGLGLKEVVATHDEALGDLTETVNDNSEALVKTAEVVNAISADVNANKAAIETKADKTDFEELAKYTADMGKKVNDIGDEVTSLSDAATTAVARIDEDIVNLKKAGLTAADALEANRQDIDANKAAIAENTASLKEQEKANEGFNNAIASLDEDISTLKKVGLAAADALEVNRQDIDANKAAIDKKADKADFEELAKYTADMGKKVNDIGDEVTALSDATSAAITRHDKDIVDLAQAGLKATEALEANRQDIDANKAAIDKKADKADIEIAKKAAVEAEKSAKSVQGSVEVAQKSAETAEGYAKAAQTSADAANNVASAAQTAAAQAQDAVKANAAQVAANKADIATLQTASNQHAAGIAKNSARIDSLDKNVANLRKETRQGLAAQAALSGLFQPYSVGKFNVTAALGGFKSDTAVAVGAGYRFNENFAAKAGLAVGTSSGSSASYNVGVNYEW